jgi:hypothetical protein
MRLNVVEQACNKRKSSAGKVEAGRQTEGKGGVGRVNAGQRPIVRRAFEDLKRIGISNTQMT